MDTLSRQDHRNYPGPHLLTEYAYKPCTIPLAQLERIKISDLRLERIHRETYIIAKVVTSPRENLKMTVVIQDEDGEALIMQLCNQDVEGDTPASSVLDEGMVVVIKELYLMFLNKGVYVLRVDHVGNILWLVDGDSRIPAAWQRTPLQKSALQWKEEGNKLVRQKRYWDAIVK